MNWFNLVFICLIGLVLSQSCTYNTSNGFYFDFEDLTILRGPDYTYQMLDSTFYINICAAVQSVNCSSQSVCQITENNNTIGCGSSSNWTFSFDIYSNITTITYDYGDKTDCSTNRKSNIALLCSPNQTTPMILSGYESDECIFSFTLASIYGCPLITPKPSIVPSPPSKNPFTIWDIIFFVLVILIILTGIIGILVGIGLFIRNRLRKVEHV